MITTLSMLKCGADSSKNFYKRTAKYQTPKDLYIKKSFIYLYKYKCLLVHNFSKINA